MSFVRYVRSPRAGPGAFLAVAAYEGLSAPTVLSLVSSVANIDRRLDLEIFAGNCHVDDARNRLVRDFLETDCEQMVMLDTDVLWPDADLKRLLDADKDIVAGIYPRRADDQPFPVKPLPGERWAGKDGLVEVEAVPTGFLKIRRHVLETLYERVERHRSTDDAPSRNLIPIIFERTLDGLSRRGGDFEFCRKAREAGFKVYVDPRMDLGHQGSKIYYGSLGHHWRRHIAIPEGLKDIRAGTESAETYYGMFGAWNNPYALSHCGLLTAVAFARRAEGPILECGAGLSTLVMAAATEQKVVSLEHVPLWATRVAKQAKACGLDNVEVRLCDEKQYDAGRWYDEVPEGEFAFVLCDGMEDRHCLFSLMAGQIAAAPILVDDIERPDWRREVDRYCRNAERQLVILDDGPKGFGLIQ